MFDVRHVRNIPTRRRAGDGYSREPDMGAGAPSNVEYQGA